ncbi:hypothetical protein CDD83_9028 [Cordyceps sp. RAO-2017]|nr:hypothetical protein CDD83_9028 [Cordyceps sp. RAO-2017]
MAARAKLAPARPHGKRGGGAGNPGRAQESEQRRGNPSGGDGRRSQSGTRPGRARFYPQPSAGCAFRPGQLSSSSAAPSGTPATAAAADASASTGHSPSPQPPGASSPDRLSTSISIGRTLLIRPPLDTAVRPHASVAINRWTEGLDRVGLPHYVACRYEPLSLSPPLFLSSSPTWSVQSLAPPGTGHVQRPRAKQLEALVGPVATTHARAYGSYSSGPASTASATSKRERGPARLAKEKAKAEAGGWLERGPASISVRRISSGIPDFLGSWQGPCLLRRATSGPAGLGG